MFTRAVNKRVAQITTKPNRILTPLFQPNVRWFQHSCIRFNAPSPPQEPQQVGAAYGKPRNPSASKTAEKEEEEEGPLFQLKMFLLAGACFGLAYAFEYKYLITEVTVYPDGTVYDSSDPNNNVRPKKVKRVVPTQENNI